MNPIRLTPLAAACTIALLGSAAAQPIPPANVPGGSPPGVYSPPPSSPPPPGQYGGPGQQGTTNSACVRLESELARLDAGNGGPDSSRRYEDAIARQRFELDQTTAQGRRLGCDSGGGFFLFGSPKPPQCDQINAQITRMRSNLDRMINEMNQSRGGSMDLNRDMQRRQILAALQQNNCGSQYRSAPPQQAARQRGFLETLFGGWQEESNINASPLDLPSSSTFRTLCVRTCDGYYFPISYATVPSRFGEDERTCKRLCPAADVALYTHRNPGEEIEQAMSLAGLPYTQLPAAFKYRQEYNSACSCRAAGQSWADALGVGRDATVQQGDIIVTDERAKQLAQPRVANQPPKGNANTPATPAQNQQQPATGDNTQPQTPQDQATPSGERKVRTVGPQFYPVR
ncbi:MAG TPA: DUF2865 domain-containing protein [Xanthobacteraceae bacterium]|nr:DUF2865 domain-containing protein [Xanthobacteraceae bacterium]